MEENRALNDLKALLVTSKGIGSGSGFFVGESLIATNIHVVAGATSISARVVGVNTAHTIEGVAAFDAQNDIVILKVSGKGTPVPIGDSDLLQRGDIVQAIGYPSTKWKVTEGTVHSILHSNKWIQMKIKTSDGNSGGPVLNRNGEVVGIAVSGEMSYSHAIPANILKMLA